MRVRYNSELTDREYILAKKHRNAAYWDLRRTEEMTSNAAQSEMDRIERKVKEIDDFEFRQQKRAEAINMARITASIAGSNTLLVMSEV